MLCLCVLLVFVSLFSKAQEVDIQIIQEGRKLVPKNDLYVLAPKSFSFQIRSSGIEGFLLGVTTDESIYRSAMGEADLEVMWFEETGMAESLFNNDKELFVNDEAPSYWYFTSTEDHRFDLGANGTSRSWQAFRTISSFYVMESEESISVKDMKEPLYLYFYVPIYDDNYDLVDRKSIFKAKVVWE